MVDQWSVTIPELSGKTERRVYVYLPEQALRRKNARYPVLYMFDGHNVFFDTHATYGKSWGMKTYMDKTRTKMIIVAVECNHGKNHARLKEYAPYTFQREGFGRITGKGETYMRWLIDTLKPIIDERYPTLPDRAHTYIAGSSMGGLMSLYAVLAHNDVFSRAACLSPSLWTQPRKLQQLISTAVLTPDTVIYMDYGSREMANHPGMLPCYSAAAKALLDKQVHLTCRIIPGGEHCEACWEEQIPYFMSTLLYRRG